MQEVLAKIRKIAKDHLDIHYQELNCAKGCVNICGVSIETALKDIIDLVDNYGNQAEKNVGTSDLKVTRADVKKLLDIQDRAAQKIAEKMLSRNSTISESMDLWGDYIKHTSKVFAYKNVLDFDSELIKKMEIAYGVNN